MLYGMTTSPFDRSSRFPSSALARIAEAPRASTFASKLARAGSAALSTIEAAYRDGGVSTAARSVAELAYWRLDPRVRRWYRRREIESARDREFDAAFGIDTSAEVSLSDLGLDKLSAHQGNGVYRAVWKDTFDAALAALPASSGALEGATFVDYGSGKGKALLLAAKHPFREIVGVEYADPLCEIAERNVTRFPKSHMRCKNLRVVRGDARDLEVPAGPVVCFFFNPFTAEVWRSVLARLATSWRSNPRPMHLIYVNPRNTRESKAVFRHASPFAKVASGRDFDIYAPR
jgi:hypothetical protein